MWPANLGHSDAFQTCRWLDRLGASGGGRGRAAPDVTGTRAAPRASWAPEGVVRTPWGRGPRGIAGGLRAAPRPLPAAVSPASVTGASFVHLLSCSCCDFRCHRARRSACWSIQSVRWLTWHLSLASPRWDLGTWPAVWRQSRAPASALRLLLSQLHGLQMSPRPAGAAPRGAAVGLASPPPPRWAGGARTRFCGPLLFCLPPPLPCAPRGLRS